MGLIEGKDVSSCADPELSPEEMFEKIKKIKKKQLTF